MLFKFIALVLLLVVIANAGGTYRPPNDKNFEDGPNDGHRKDEHHIKHDDDDNRRHDDDDHVTVEEVSFDTDDWHPTKGTITGVLTVTTSACKEESGDFTFGRSRLRCDKRHDDDDKTNDKKKQDDDDDFSVFECKNVRARENRAYRVCHVDDDDKKDRHCGFVFVEKPGRNGHDGKDNQADNDDKKQQPPYRKVLPKNKFYGN